MIGGRYANNAMNRKLGRAGLPKMQRGGGNGYNLQDFIDNRNVIPDQGYGYEFLKAVIADEDYNYNRTHRLAPTVDELQFSPIVTILKKYPNLKPLYAQVATQLEADFAEMDRQHALQYGGRRYRR
jgi:hypothetical protein